MDANKGTGRTKTSVAELLVSQTETCDFVDTNKVDLLIDIASNTGGELSNLQQILKAFNPRAKILTTSHGKVSIKDVLTIAGTVDVHRDFVTGAMATEDEAKKVASVDKSLTRHGRLRRPQLCRVVPCCAVPIRAICMRILIRMIKKKNREAVAAIRSCTRIYMTMKKKRKHRRMSSAAVAILVLILISILMKVPKR